MDKKEIADQLILAIEQETKKKVFTLRVIEGRRPVKNRIDTLVVFDDQSILDARITIGSMEGDSLGIRIQGNYI